MQRRKFVKSAGILTLGLSAFSLGFAGIRKFYDDEGPIKISDLAGISDALEAEFQELLAWMRANGWTVYLNSVLGVDMSLTGDALLKELIKELDTDRLKTLRNNVHSGYDDFSGERLVQPGFPAYSLLFHTMASPRVRPPGIKEFPSLHQIDLLENYIYALCSWQQLKSIYGIDKNEDLVFAVFAYEYRPAFKTPHHAYADMVYSRTGIARIGEEPINYDATNRCHTNEPADKNRDKSVAVVPARYGLFIAAKVKPGNISLVSEATHKGDDTKDDRNDEQKTFLQPIRKVFNNDLLVGEEHLHFQEIHKNEKLQKLAEAPGITTWPVQLITPRYSKDLVEQDNKLRRAGSSFLVISKHAPLIRKARENGHPLFFAVPKEFKEPYDNRYFTAYCTQKVEDVELLEGYENLVRVYNKYDAPRNQPLFVNITNKKENDTGYAPIPHTIDDSFEHTVQKGKYYAPLFEDSICDGHVNTDVTSFRLTELKGMTLHCLPAFSVVTAPDFFPQVDPLDLASFDVAPGTSTESNFYEGGVASLATARIKPNPKMIDTKSDPTSDTYLAVLSDAAKSETGIEVSRLPVYRNPSSDRGYELSGFLPDVASSVFAPGWDVTYCSDSDYSDDIYIGTEGLGSPFIEDMKFCSALNGMWPATSPDAARTYQGANETNYRNPTAVPLLDTEIGINAGAPGGKYHECTGWDGEQGPFLEKRGDQWKINFTDLGRADAIDNALNGRLDMQKLRKLKSAELIARMDCLKSCIHALPQKNFHEEIYKKKIPGYTYLWLVSAEKVNWGTTDAIGYGIPDNLAGNNKEWITRKENARVQGEGYLYVFANSAADAVSDDNGENDDPKDWADDLKRRRLDCLQIYICQVTSNNSSGNKVAWTEIKEGKINWQST